MKKYALRNSYFKYNNMSGFPDTIFEIAKYHNEHGELPFRYDGANWVYNAFVERQKYRGVHNSQYLTPDATCERLMYFAGRYFTKKEVLEPCCGTGQITKELLKTGYHVTAFDNDPELVKLCKIQYPDIDVFQSDCGLLWKLLRECMIEYQGIFLNLDTMNTNPIKIKQES